MVAAVAASIYPHPLTSRPGEPGKHRSCDRLPGALKRGLGAFGIDLGLIPGRLEAGDTLPQVWVVQIGYATLDGIVKPLEPRIGFGGPLVEFADMIAAPLGAFLAAVQDCGQNLFQPLWDEQTLFEMVCNKIVQLRHGNRTALTARLALPSLGRAGVVPVAAALPGPERHRAAADGTKADAGKEGRPTGDPRRSDAGMARFQVRLNGVEGLLVDDGRNIDRDHFAHRLEFLGLGSFVELMAADIGGTRQDTMHLPHAPAPAIPGEDATAIEIADHLFDAQGSANAVPVKE